MTGSNALPGRKAEAARNDAAILAAARTVFMREPGASMAAVAAEAGVGVGGLYRRYASKDELLQKLCGDGLRRFNDLAGGALADTTDPWGALAGFIRDVIDADVHSLTVRLAGTFTSTAELRALADHSGAVVAGLVARAQRAGVIRDGFVAADLPMIFEQVTAVRVDDPERTRELRRRYLSLVLDGVRAAGAMSGSPPTPAELGMRWRRPVS